MRLHKFDEIQLSSVHPTNPITGETIQAYLQYFVVTRDVEGVTIPAGTLHPCHMADVPMSAVIRLNGVPIQ